MVHDGMLVCRCTITTVCVPGVSSTPSCRLEPCSAASHCPPRFCSTLACSLPALGRYFQSSQCVCACRGTWHFASREMLLHSWVCRESDVYSLGNMLACLAKLRCFPFPREYTWRDIAALAMQPDGGLPEVCPVLQHIVGDAPANQFS